MKMLNRAAMLIFILFLGLICVNPSWALEEDELAEIVDVIHNPDEQYHFSFPEDAYLIRVVFPKIRECDACLITDGTESVLIDCATDKQASAVTDMLIRQNISKLDAVYISHPHSDHCGGLEIIFQNFDVDAVYTCFSDTITEAAKLMKSVCEKYNVPLRRYDDGYTFTVGKASFKTYRTGEQIYSINDRSAAFRMQIGRSVMFFAADLERLGLRRVGNTVDPDELRMDIIKYPHHGKDPLVREFWKPAQLRFAVVTSDNLMRAGKQDLKNKGWTHAFTWDGEIILTTDGNTWYIDYVEMTPRIEEQRDEGEIPIQINTSE